MWTFNGTQITVVDLKETDEENVVKLQPIDAGTVYQYFGYTNDTYTLQCYIVGSGDANTLKALAKTGIAYDLSFGGVSLGTFYLDKITIQWLTSYSQNFRIDKSPIDLVFKAALDLSKA
jgi:phage protein U